MWCAIKMGFVGVEVVQSATLHSIEGFHVRITVKFGCDRRAFEATKQFCCYRVARPAVRRRSCEG